MWTPRALCSPLVTPAHLLYQTARRSAIISEEGTEPGWITMCFVVCKTTSKLEHAILTTLYLTGTKNTDTQDVLFTRVHVPWELVLFQHLSWLQHSKWHLVSAGLKLEPCFRCKSWSCFSRIQYCSLVPDSNLTLVLDWSHFRLWPWPAHGFRFKLILNMLAWPVLAEPDLDASVQLQHH
jgi:hypothetical protein